MIRIFVTFFFLCVASSASANAALTRLYDILRMDDYVLIAQTEGLQDLDEISQDMLGRPASGSFLTQMQKVYDFGRMRETVMQGMQNLSAEDTKLSLLFFDSEVGTRITELELSARQAIADKTIEEAAKAAWQSQKNSDAPIKNRIGEIMEATDLIDGNVSGALNSNLRFYQGLIAGGGLELSEEQILQSVWGQEAEIRADTTDWLHAYLLMAYSPLGDNDLDIYVKFWNTDVGQALNSAIFAGFNEMYDTISYATGRLVALNMNSQDL